MENKEKEEWRPVPGFEKDYMVSSYGRIKSLCHKDYSGHIRKEKIRKSGKVHDGYEQIVIQSKNKRKVFYVHRLVALVFLDNPNGYKYVNHKDNNASNNNKNNLEWCTALYNNMYMGHNAKVGRSLEKPIYATSNKGHIYFFKSSKMACQVLGVSSGHLSSCLHGKLKHTGGFAFNFYN